MSVRKSAKLEKFLGAAALVTLIVLAITAQVLESPAPSRSRSAASVAPQGRRALFLLLEELGHAPKLWNRAPGKLPSGANMLWLGGVPHGPGFESKHKAKDKSKDDKSAHDEDEADKDEEADKADKSGEHDASDKSETAGDAAEPAGGVLASALDLHQPVHYRRFLEEGGTIIAPLDDALSAFFVQNLGLASVATLERDQGLIAKTGRLRLESGEEFEVALEAHAGFRPLAEGSSARELVVATSGADDKDPNVVHESDTLFAVELPVGAGRLVLLADDGFLANSMIGARDQALFAVRLVESLDRGGELLFDEYSLGLWEPASPIGMAASPRWFLLSLHAGLLLCLFLWSQAWVRQFPRDPQQLGALSPLSRARAQGRLWLQAGRAGRAARALQLGVLTRLERAVGLRPRAASKRPWAEEVDERLAVVEARSRAPLPRARWQLALARTAVNDEVALASLAEELAQLESAYLRVHEQLSSTGIASSGALAR